MSDIPLTPQQVRMTMDCYDFACKNKKHGPIDLGQVQLPKGSPAPRHLCPQCGRVCCPRRLVKFSTRTDNDKTLRYDYRPADAK